MAKPLSLNYTFGTQASPIPLGYLDTNYTQITTAINDSLTYSNYLVDIGTANTYVVNFSGSIGVSYTAGLLIQFKIANANTGASTLNVSSLGTKTIVNTNGSSLVAGQLPASGIALVQYDGTNFQLLNDPSAGQVLPTPLPVTQGGTGITTVPTNGQVLIGNGTNYTAATITAGSGALITNGAGSITIATTGATGLPTFVTVSSTTVTAVNGAHYALTNAATSTLTLPLAPTPGDLVWVTSANGKDNNIVNPNGEKIQGVTGNYIISTPYSSFQFRYITSGMGWAVIGWGPFQIGAQDYILESYGIT